MRSIHRQRGAKHVEPHAVDHLGHVPRPVCLIHSLDLFLREDLLVHTAQILLPEVVQLSGRVEQSSVQGSRERLVGVLGVRHKIFVARSLGSDFLLRFEWLQQCWLLSCTLLL